MLEAPEESYAPASTARRRRSQQPEPASPREFGEDFASNLPDTEEDSEPYSRRQRGGYRVRFQGRVLQLPKSLWGRVAGAAGFLAVVGAMIAGMLALRSFFLHDPRFVVESSSSIHIVGNTHLTRAQLLSIFGEDVERNIFNVPLAERRAELERLPWVEYATVMRLLPNHLRIGIVERTPVAFVRQGSQIGMVDAGGVLLDMPPNAPGDPQYSFPVITGISADDPLSTRAARMRIYTSFTSDLDSTGNHISEKLSEVDLSNPEDVKALIPEGSADILVHFGDTDFLSRYQKFEEHLQEWRNQYPRLASVDMRYERQVVLEMQPGASVPSKDAAAKPDAPAAPEAKAPVRKPAARPIAKAKPAGPQPWHMVVVKPHASGKPAAPKPTAQAVQQ